ncbi:MAG: tRNA pseudouridine(55) synthase TruB [Bacteroidales bacterium]|nr:tRNA pseudouridine(55) synthase TruB [Bacteroidales bacterium]
MREYNFEAGEVLVFDKPLHWTSFNLVKIVRNSLSRRMGIKRLKVGHAGTLDPLASGVMIVCTGRATKNIDQLQAGTKEYIATMQLGATTPSFDREHSVDHTYPVWHIDRKLVEETLPKFLGSIMQVPPVYSACKVEGRRAFDYARSGEEVELKAKELVIDAIELLSFTDPEEAAQQGRKPELTIRVVCSKGTYIRALARDIGEALGSGAYLTALRRTRVGQYSLEDCHVAVCDVEQWAAQVPIIRETE